MADLLNRSRANALPNKFSLRRYYRQSIALVQNQSYKVAFAGILGGIKMRSLAEKKALI
ncbi:MAG: hypothetical protein KME17_01595 [Cyanosarcina radialis HA8281-LM2]|nr:hypothetical protein [Cyanosarcina radialis HA8281-LM2]